jgi:hypothetical protein
MAAFLLEADDVRFGPEAAMPRLPTAIILGDKTVRSRDTTAKSGYHCASSVAVPSRMGPGLLVSICGDLLLRAMMRPEGVRLTPRTRYARSGDVSIAYQVVGDGPADLVMVFGYVWSIELIWEEPMLARFLTRLSSYARLIIFDKRGTGLSDRMSGVASLEVRMDDVRAVMDAAESRQATLFGLPKADPCACCSQQPIPSVAPD